MLCQWVFYGFWVILWIAVAMDPQWQLPLWHPRCHVASCQNSTRSQRHLLRPLWLGEKHLPAMIYIYDRAPCFFDPWPVFLTPCALFFWPLVTLFFWPLVTLFFWPLALFFWPLLTLFFWPLGLCLCEGTPDLLALVFLTPLPCFFDPFCPGRSRASGPQKEVS